MSISSWRHLAMTPVIAAVITCTICRADTTGVVTLQIDPAAVKQDLRLATPVTLSARNIPLKKVLDQFAAQSGVEISIDERDPASGYPVLVECNKVPVGRMMDAFYGLFSIRRGEWAWLRTEKKGAYSYVLHETPWAKNRTETYDKIVSSMLRNYLSVLRELSPMNMQERRLHRDALKKALFVDDDARIDGYFEEEMFWTQASFFFNALSPEQQESVLQGAAVDASLKDVTPAAYDLFHKCFVFQNGHHANEDGSLSADPEPDSVQFFSPAPNLKRKQIAPMIFLVEGPISESWMGTGTLEFGIRDAIKAAWILPGDKVTNAVSSLAVKETIDSEDVRKEREVAIAYDARIRAEVPERLQDRLPSPGSVLSISTRLEQLSLGTSTPVVAVLPTDASGGLETPVGRPAQQFLDHLEGRPKELFYKWRDGVLIVSHPFWFTQPVPAISYSLLNKLHADSSGQVSIVEWIGLMKQISDDQADWFAASYGYGIDNMKKLRHLLATP